MKYRKKPVVVDAVQWQPDEDVATQARANEGVEVKDALDVIYVSTEKGVLTSIDTLEGRALLVSPGDWIITGIKGERYPCKPDIFEQTYEPANVPTTPDVRLREALVDLIQSTEAFLEAAPPATEWESPWKTMRIALTERLDKAHAALAGGEAIETAWLVENIQRGGQPLWVHATYEAGNDKDKPLGYTAFGFTTDSNKAIKFLRKDDAEQFIDAIQSELFNRFGDYVLQATEHQWG